MYFKYCDGWKKKAMLCQWLENVIFREKFWMFFLCFSYCPAQIRAGILGSHSNQLLLAAYGPVNEWVERNRTAVLLPMWWRNHAWTPLEHAKWMNCGSPFRLVSLVLSQSEAVFWDWAYFLHLDHSRKALYSMLRCGGGNRTHDLEIMRLTSYRCSTPQCLV